MKYGQVNFNFISKNNKTAATFKCLNDCYSENKDINSIFDFRIIDNITSPIEVYQDDFYKNRTERCHLDDLTKKIESILQDDSIKIIIINFLLDLNYVKDSLIELAIKYDAVISVNVALDREFEKSFCVHFDKKIMDLDDDEWNEICSEVYEQLNDYMKKSEKEEPDEEEYAGLFEDLDEEEKKEILDLFNLGELTKWESAVESAVESINYDSDKEDYIDRFKHEKIKESYNHRIKDNDLTISLTADNDILISDGDETVKIIHGQLSYLFGVLKSFINI